MHWTTQKPSQPGYWWHKEVNRQVKEKTKYCVHMMNVKKKNGCLYVIGWGEVDKLTGQWAGPIPETADGEEGG